jgi:hypothetical protein
MGFENPVVGGTALRIPAIQSPNYVSGSSGWIIKIDGSAEFNNLTVRGEFMGTDFVINQSGIFLYSGTPAAGNLVGSWASVSGTDDFGNAFLAGLSAGNETTRQLLLRYNGTTASVDFLANNGHENSPGKILGAILNQGAANEYESLQLQGPSVLTHTDAVDLLLSSQAEDGSSNANFSFVHSVAGSLMSLDNTALILGVVAQFLAGVQVTGNALVSGAAVKSSSGSAVTWQAASGLGTGWAIGPSAGTVQSLQYRLDAEDNLVLVGAVHSTSTTPAATIFTLPTGYRPKVTQRGPGVSNQGGTATARYVEINSSGAVSINANLATSGTDVYFNTTVPMGNIS